MFPNAFHNSDEVIQKNLGLLRYARNDMSKYYRHHVITRSDSDEVIQKIYLDCHAPLWSLAMTCFIHTNSNCYHYKLLLPDSIHQ